MLVLGEVVNAITAQGMNVGLGFLHEPSNRKPSLALDLLELFRQPIIDRLTLSLINKRVFITSHFTFDVEKGCRLKNDALQKYLKNKKGIFY